VRRPGSAPGAIWVELPAEKVVFTGDALTVNAPPPMQEVDLDDWLEALAELRKARFPAQVIVPGRGAPTDKKAVAGMQEFIRQARRKLQSLAKAHKPRTELAPLADELVEYFHVTHTLREHYARRLRAGLEHLYDQMTAAPAL